MGTRVECISTLTRVAREGWLDAASEALARARLVQVLGTGEEVRPTEDLRDRAVRVLGVHALRAGDALQLAAALIWARERPRGRDFVCLDERLRAVARREGFNVLPAR